MQQPQFFSRDTVNYFHYLGQRYPEVTIADSESRVFASLFRHQKAYVMLKSTDTEMLTNIDKITLNLYRKGVMLFLCINYHVAGLEKPIMSFLPIDSILDNLPNPRYPDEGELLQFEIHLLNYFKIDRLEKVIQFHVVDMAFQKELVELYQYQHEANYERSIAIQDTKAFFSYPFTKLNKFLVASTNVTIDKQEPDNYEPLRNSRADSVFDGY
ncbi:hypothetical protein M2G93_16915 [Vibrio vulnificus]|uniref:hypothetical protein n=1 Tax=Vibrio TaxID=662 RepID=UPI0004DF473C|nr:hypothetical protein [Vibrio parahaemolyticus]EGQ9239453.1 hypothetical protein [Vibrio vulnificus]EHD1698094.1 hypothetical protein [Vibrio vulnificus]EKZ9225823.1 hypothetical protein [Vibrio vulnificus]ELC9582665.1 hypothetical protein [Vibrio vulnificus]MCU8149798.1 hypothetical protein [Vibrio vulnificus]